MFHCNIIDALMREAIGTAIPIGILLSGTELLGSPVRTEFCTGSLYAVSIWFTTEFFIDCRVQQVLCLSHFDVTAEVTQSSDDGDNQIHC